MCSGLTLGAVGITVKEQARTPKPTKPPGFVVHGIDGTASPWSVDCDRLPGSAGGHSR